MLLVSRPLQESIISVNTHSHDNASKHVQGLEDSATARV